MSQNGSGFWAGELDGLVGRDAPLARLRDLLDSGSRTAVVTGIAGAGKTSVLAVVARAEAAEGRLVLPLTCHESDRDLPFGALVDLLSAGPDAVDVLEHVVPDPARVGAIDPLRLRLEVLTWLERISERQGVVVVVDDAHWCDDTSLSVLGFLSHRLAGSNASVLVAARGDTPPLPFRRHPQVALAPLVEVDARAVLRHAGLSLDAMTLPSVIERAAGNPLALLELGRAAASGAPDDAVPSSVETAFREQVSLLSDGTRQALLLAAAGDGDLGVLHRATEPGRLMDSLAPAEAAGLVTVADRRVRFRHPLVRSAAYTSASTADRLAAHAALAAAYEADPERRSWHRAEATVVPDEDVARALAEAAALALRRGASTEAARFMVRASELSPGRSERDERLLEALQITCTAGDFEWVVTVGGRLQVEAADPAVRVWAAQVTAYALAQTGRSSAARRALVGVLEQLVEIDPFSGWSSLTTLAVLTYRAGWEVAEVAHWLDVYERATDIPATPFPELVVAGRAWIRLQIDPLSLPPDIMTLVRDAPVPDYPMHVVATHEMLLGAAAWLLDEPVVAIERFERAVDLMRRSDSLDEMTQTLMGLGLVKFAVGDYDAVDGAGRLVVDLAESHGQHHATAHGHALQARAAAVRGDAEGARDLCNRVLQELVGGEALGLEITVRVTMSWVRMAEHDPLGAWNELRWLFDEDGEPRHPHICYRELGHFAATAVRAGAVGELERVLQVADRRLVDPRPFHRLQLARARALAAGEDAEPWHVAAVGDATAGRWPFELANARLEYGAWLRRRYRQTDARMQLQPALDAFDRLGARPWADLARAELRAAGVATEAVEPSTWAALTGQERQVVRLAAAGKTNPEIAAALYLSPRTVSTHLYNAFPKLGVTARAQLRDVVPGPT